MISTSRMSGHLGERGASLGQQRGRHQLEHAVLRPGDPHLAGQPGAARDPEPFHRRHRRARPGPLALRPRRLAMVNLTRIYTRTGDDGTTALGDMRPDQQERRPARAPTPTSTRPTARSAWRSASGGLDDGRRGAADRGCRTTCSTSAPTCAPRSSRDPEYPPLRVEQDLRRRGSRPRCDRFNARPRAAAVVRPAGRHAGAPPSCTSRAPSSAGPSGPPGRRSSEHGDTDEPADRDVPQPALRPAVHPRPGRQPRAAATCCGCPARTADRSGGTPARDRPAHRSRSFATFAADTPGVSPANVATISVRRYGERGRATVTPSVRLAATTRARPGSR